MGMGLEFILLISTFLCPTGALIVSFVVNWHLSLILLCLFISVFSVSFVLGKVLLIVELILSVELF